MICVKFISNLLFCQMRLEFNQTDQTDQTLTGPQVPLYRRNEYLYVAENVGEWLS